MRSVAVTTNQQRNAICRQRSLPVVSANPFSLCYRS